MSTKSPIPCWMNPRVYYNWYLFFVVDPVLPAVSTCDCKKWIISVDWTAVWASCFAYRTLDIRNNLVTTILAQLLRPIFITQPIDPQPFNHISMFFGHIMRIFVPWWPGNKVDQHCTGAKGREHFCYFRRKCITYSAYFWAYLKMFKQGF